MSIPRLLELAARPPNRLWLRYADGTAGEVDLHDLVGRGVFAPLADPRVFAAATIGDASQVHWSPDLELCSDSLYLRLTGLSPKEAFPRLRGAPQGA